jgi:hypothetical protein
VDQFLPRALYEHPLKQIKPDTVRSMITYLHTTKLSICGFGPYSGILMPPMTGFCGSIFLAAYFGGRVVALIPFLQLSTYHSSKSKDPPLIFPYTF